MCCGLAQPARRLLARVGDFSIRRTRQVIIAAVGGVLMAIMLSQAFGRIYGGL